MLVPEPPPQAERTLRLATTRVESVVLMIQRSLLKESATHHEQGSRHLRKGAKPHVFSSLDVCFVLERRSQENLSTR